ncbi:MAG: carboxypeptidase regulatory-like domain-containing protein [Planctomycetales bacterium]|nr:carboxypeptidase regulatory-like domain-containing protein [Planctomycetales bacterium]
MRQALYFCWALFLIVAFTGCGNGNIGHVEGTVTLDGKPLPNAGIEFFPQAGGGLSAGRTDENGHYELYYGREGMGAEVGEHLVQIRTAGIGSADGDYGPTSKELIPVQYNNRSELVRTVKAGSNTIDFDLESKGRIVQPPSGY